MSWSTKFLAKNREVARVTITEQQLRDGSYFPERAKDALIAILDTLPPEVGISVDASGHADSHNGNCRVQIETVRIIDK